MLASKTQGDSYVSALAQAALDTLHLVVYTRRGLRGALCLHTPLEALYIAALPTMLRNTFQSGFLSLLYSMGSKPLQLWEEKTAEDGAVKRIVDEDLQSKVIEISASNIARTYIACPSDPRRTLGIRFV